MLTLNAFRKVFLKRNHMMDDFMPDGNLCAAYGCFEVRAAKGLCRRHYQQLRRFGTINRIEAQAQCQRCHGWFKPKSKTSAFCSKSCARTWRRGHPNQPRPKPWILYTEFLEVGTFKPIKCWELDDDGNLIDATSKHIDPHKSWPEMIERDRAMMLHPAGSRPFHHLN
ncbi:hypothetical protein IHR29_01595 [Bifidobacterium dentium]|nr:hypothetical protein [Bifidobacterium dentium]